MQLLQWLIGLSLFVFLLFWIVEEQWSISPNKIASFVQGITVNAIKQNDNIKLSDFTAWIYKIFIIVKKSM